MDKVVRIIKWVLVLILIWTIGWAVSVATRDGPVLGPSKVMALDDPTAAQGPLDPAPILPSAVEVNYTAILNQDLFGGTGTAPVPERPNGNGSSPLSIGDVLGMALVGTVTVSGDAQVARAVLRDIRTKATTVYKIGDKVEDATIEAISRDEVVFRYQGRSRTLRHAAWVTAPLPQAQASGEPVAPAGPRDPAAADRQPAARAQPTSDYVQQLLDKATITPVAADGQVEGIQINGLDQIPGARQLGLVEGDVIQVVNGQRLTNLQKAFQVFKKARSQEKLEIELLRKGQAKTLSFDLR
jgi:type II secretion system protein C